MRNYFIIAMLIIHPLLVLAQEDSLKVQTLIKEVVVTAPEQRQNKTISTTTVDRQKIEQQHNSSLLPSLTQHIPSLFVTSRGVMGYGVSTGAAGGITLRGVGGSPTTALMVLIDGHPQYMGLMGHPIADACQSSLAERVEVSRGPASVLYGSNAMGGVINITSRQKQEDGMDNDLDLSYGSYNSMQASLGNRLKAGRFTSATSLNYNRADGHRKNMEFDQIGAMVKLGYSLSKNWDIASFGNLTHFNTSNPGPIQMPIIDNDASISRYNVSLSLKNYYKKTLGAVSLFYNFGKHKINDGYDKGSTPLDYRFNSQDNMLGVTLYQTFMPLKGNSTTIGFDYRHTGGKAWNSYLNGSADKTIADKSTDNIAAYITMHQRITPGLSFDAGLRFDYHSKIGTEWIPEGALTLALPHNLSLKAIVSKGFRYPTLREMYMFPTQNPNLKSESMINYELALEQTIPDNNISYGVNIYYIDGKNIIQTLPVNGRPTNVNNGRIENWGIECQVAWNITQTWHIASNYSYLHMKYPVVAAPKHKLYAGTTFKKGRLFIDSGVQYINGLITQTRPLLTEHNIVLWNAGIEIRIFKLSTWYARVENILAQRYQINAGYPMPRTTFMTGAKIKF